MFRSSIREVLWLKVVVDLVVGVALEHRASDAAKGMLVLCCPVP
jgi:hypothetical protein